MKSEADRSRYRRSALTAIITGAFMGISGSAFAQVPELKWENNSGGSAQIYGLLHPALTSFHDGDDVETWFLDNDLAPSRIGLRLAQRMWDHTFGFRFETALGLPNTTEVDQFGSFFSGWTREDIRHVDLSVEGNWGTISAGQGSMVSDGAAEIDLSYVGTTLYSFSADENASYIFRDKAGGLAGNPIIVDSTDNFDGGRRARIRYDTPGFYGFSAGVAWGQNHLSSDDDDDYYDIGVFYENEFAGGTELAAGVAYGIRHGASDRADLIASASLLLANGFNFTVAAGHRDDMGAGASDPRYLYGKVGYEADWLPFGQTGVGVDYTVGRDYNSDGSETNVWGVALVQEIRRINTDAYVKYRSHHFDENAASYQHTGTFVLGAIVSF